MPTTMIVQFPNAAPGKVQQTRRCGRLPKEVAKLREFKWLRDRLAEDKDLIASEIVIMENFLKQHRQIESNAQMRLALLSDPNMTKCERDTWIEEIRFERLPWEDRERIEAMRKGLGKVFHMPRKPRADA